MSQSTPPGSGRSILDALDRHRADLHALPGVLGVAVGLGPMGEEVVVLYLAGPPVDLPDNVEGYPVQTVTTGPIDALGDRAGEGHRTDGP